MAHPSQVHPSQGHHSPTQIPCGQVTDVSSHSGQPLPPTLNVPGAEGRSLSTERIVFSVGGEVGSERNMRGSSTSMASAVGGDISGREGGGTLPQTSGYSKVWGGTKGYCRCAVYMCTEMYSVHVLCIM